MNNPLVSVIIPTYNYAEYIAQAIESVLVQTYPNIEILVIDDGSTDETASTVLKFSNTVRYYYQTNQGLSAARNRGIKLSNGTYIQFLDSDDRLDRQSIEAKVHYLNRNPDKVFACSPNRLYFENRSQTYNWIKNFFYGWKLPNQREILPSLCYSNVAPVHAFLTRLEAIRVNSIFFDESLKACEDYDFWLRLAAKFGIFGVVTVGPVLYRKHTTSMSSDFSNQNYHDALMVVRAYSALCDGELSDNRLKLEFLTANLAATLKIYYLLSRSTKQNEQLSNLSIHLDRLNLQIESLPNCKTTRVTRYIAEMRIYAFKLWKEKKLHSITILEIITLLGGRRLFCCPAYLYDNLKDGSATPELINILLLDLQYLYLRSIEWMGKFRSRFSMTCP